MLGLGVVQHCAKQHQVSVGGSWMGCLCPDLEKRWVCDTLSSTDNGINMPCKEMHASCLPGTCMPRL